MKKNLAFLGLLFQASVVWAQSGPVYNFHFQNYPAVPAPTPATTVEEAAPVVSLPAQAPSQVTQGELPKSRVKNFFAGLIYDAGTNRASLYRGQTLGAGGGFILGRFNVGAYASTNSISASFRPPDEFIPGDGGDEFAYYRESFRGDIPGAKILVSMNVWQITDALALSLGLNAAAAKGQVNHLSRPEKIGYQQASLEARVGVDCHFSDWKLALSFGRGENEQRFRSAYLTHISRSGANRYESREATGFHKTERFTYQNLGALLAYTF